MLFAEREGAAAATLDFSGLDVTVTAVPLPPAVWTLGSALVALAALARLKRPA